MDVVAHILHHLKCQLLTALENDGMQLKASDFHWVITVPAFWQSEGNEMIREAGYVVSPKLKSLIMIDSQTKLKSRAENECLNGPEMSLV